MYRGQRLIHSMSWVFRVSTYTYIDGFNALIKNGDVHEYDKIAYAKTKCIKQTGVLKREDMLAYKIYF